MHCAAVEATDTEPFGSGCNSVKHLVDLLRLVRRQLRVIATIIAFCAVAVRWIHSVINFSANSASLTQSRLTWESIFGSSHPCWLDTATIPLSRSIQPLQMDLVIERVFSSIANNREKDPCQASCGHAPFQRLFSFY